VCASKQEALEEMERFKAGLKNSLKATETDAGGVSVPRSWRSFHDVHYYNLPYMPLGQTKCSNCHAVTAAKLAEEDDGLPEVDGETFWPVINKESAGKTVVVLCYTKTYAWYSRDLWWGVSALTKGMQFAGRWHLQGLPVMYATCRCAPCKAVKPMLVHWSKEMDNVAFLKFQLTLPNKERALEVSRIEMLMDTCATMLPFLLWLLHGCQSPYSIQA
jgi:thiol-disulfide isomerase/thioredoxin